MVQRYPSRSQPTKRYGGQDIGFSWADRCIYTNHSLRATSASLMFAARVPEKIVAGFTGYKSVEALRQYERTTAPQLRAAGLAITTAESFAESVATDSKPNATVAEQQQLALEKVAKQLYLLFLGLILTAHSTSTLGPVYRIGLCYIVLRSVMTCLLPVHNNYCLFNIIHTAPVELHVI